jgi:hypothetical protein
LKVLGGAHGVGLAISLAAVEHYAPNPIPVPLKVVAVLFALGVLTFGVAFLLFNISWFALDNHLIAVKEAVQAKDGQAIDASRHSSGALSTRTMGVAEFVTYASVAAFVLALAIGIVILAGA